MKPTFKEAVDKQLSGIEFTDEMKLKVLLQVRRKRHFTKVVYAAVSGFVLLMLISFGSIFALKPHSDITVASPAHEAHKVFSSANFDVIVTNMNQENDIVEINFSILSRADYDVMLMRLPFYDSNMKVTHQATISEISCIPSFPLSGQQVIYLAAGASLDFRITLDISRRTAGQDIVLTEKFDILIPAVEIIDPEKLTKLTPAHSGPFLIRLDEIHLDPILRLVVNEEYNPEVANSRLYKAIDWPNDYWSETDVMSRYRWLGHTAVNTGLALENRESIKVEIILK